MMEKLGSAAVQGMVSGILSNISYEGRSNDKDHMERLEIAHIRLEAAVETSERWNITSPPLLRWRSKLKRAKQECDETLHKCNQRARQEEEMGEGLRDSSFPNRVSQNVRSFLSSIFNTNQRTGELNISTVRRFEWFADGASEFLRFVELGGTPPRQFMFFEPLVRHLFAGNMIRHKLVSGSQHHLLMVQPISTAQGMEGRLLYVLLDSDTPENSFFFTIFLRLSESTDIVGVAVRCLQLFTPHFKSTAETVKTKLAQVPTLDFSWVPYIDSSRKQQHWEKFYNIFSKWFRPNPHCCQQQPYADSSINSSPLQQDINLEPVIKVYLQGHVPVPEGDEYKRNKSFPYVKLRLLFSPHSSSEGILATVDGSATEMVQGQERGDHSLYANVSFEELDKIMLPKAIECLRQNAGATTVYQMIWRSRHGGAYIQAEKFTPRRTYRKHRRGRLQRQDEKVETWSRVVTDFLGRWATHAPAQLQGSIADWIQKEKKMQLAPTQV